MTVRFRRRRFDFFWNALGRNASAGWWWLDLGGGPGSYLLAHMQEIAQQSRQPIPRLVLLDIGEAELRDAQRRYPHVQLVRADGAHLPFRTQAFELVFSNSVIEHVAEPSGFAEEIRRTGRTYFIQTPNGAFPLESHSRVPLPFYRWLPPPVQQWLCGIVGAPYAYLASVNYLDERTLRNYFPQAEIVRERALGLTKSFYVLGRSDVRETPESRFRVGTWFLHQAEDA